MSAAAFAKGLLDLEGQLTPILVYPSFLLYCWCLICNVIRCLLIMSLSFLLLKVSLVSKDSSMLDGLDTASTEMEAAKVCSMMSHFLNSPP